MTTDPQFLIIVIDALRPDLVTPDRMPNLHRFSREGVHFANSRAVFPTSTRVNAAALATGATPRHSGIVHNKFYDPRIFPDRLFEPNRVAHIDAGMAAYDGKLLSTPPLGDLLHAAGKTLATFLTGSSGTARLIDPNAARHGHVNIGFIGFEESQPPGIAEELIAKHGPIPKPTRPNLDAMRLQTDMFIESIHPRHTPDVSILWYSDPDQSFHYLGIGSPESAQAMRCVDDQIGRILAWREGAGLADSLNIMVISDHGHLTARKRIDVNAEAARDGFGIGENFENGTHYAGYTSYNGSLKVRGSDGDRISQMVEWLAARPWCGLIFTPDANGDGVEGSVPGTFGQSIALTDHDRMPEVAFIMRNDDETDANGITGGCYYNGGYPEGGGTHGGLHPRELANMMAASGSLFRKGVASGLPAGIIDVAPTILHALGLSQPDTMDGRPLAEAMAVDDAAQQHAESFTRSVVRGDEVQHLRFSRVGTTTYLDRGWLERA